MSRRSPPREPYCGSRIHCHASPSSTRKDGPHRWRNMAWKRGEPRYCSMVKLLTPDEEDIRRLGRERKTLIAERVFHVNRIKGLLLVRGCDLAPRFADLIEASGHVPHVKAVHMTAPSACVKSTAKPLAPRAVPHMRLYRSENGPVIAMGSDRGSGNEGEIRCHPNDH